MITVSNLSHGFSDRLLYENISFSIEEGQHIAFIGSNGTGKTTLVEMMIHPENYTYDGTIQKDADCRIGYVTQFSKEDKNQSVSVYDFLAERFVGNQTETARLCEMMATADNLDAIFEEYQRYLDEFQAMDGDHFESNIRRQLKVAGLSDKEYLEISKLSGGEFKLIQVIKEILARPSLLIMDEPDVFLDFENLNGLTELINYYKGTILVITHNRYLLNHCFNKILHLEGRDIQSFDGNYLDYNLALLEQKVELSEQAQKDGEEIVRNEKIVEKLRGSATTDSSASRGRALRARVSYLERLKERRIKAPFVQINKAGITLPKVEQPSAGEENVLPLLSIQDYSIAFDDVLLEHVSFDIKPGEKVAIVGPNGTGKTTLLREIVRQSHPSIRISQDARIGFLSQLHGEILNEKNTIFEEFFELGFDTREQIREYLASYCFEEEALNQRIGLLSGGEKNLLQLARLARSDANLLLLDEPTSHLDTYAQVALENAIEQYHGAVLMVSHDFYVIANTADYVLLVEDRTIRKMRIRSFRKMIYDVHFDKTYLELEQKKKELESRIELAIQAYDFEKARELCEELEGYVERMNRI